MMTPDEELAALIATRLVEANLIDPARRDEVATRIGAGATTTDDWRLWIELGPAGSTQGDDDAED